MFPTSIKMFYFKIFSQHVQKNGVKSIAFVCTLYSLLFDELHDWRVESFGVPCFANNSYNIFPKLLLHFLQLIY